VGTRLALRAQSDTQSAALLLSTDGDVHGAPGAYAVAMKPPWPASLLHDAHSRVWKWIGRPEPGVSTSFLIRPIPTNQRPSSSKAYTSRFCHGRSRGGTEGEVLRLTWVMQRGDDLVFDAASFAPALDALLLPIPRRQCLVRAPQARPGSASRLGQETLRRLEAVEHVGELPDVPRAERNGRRPRRISAGRPDWFGDTTRLEALDPSPVVYSHVEARDVYH
jgi:hypothetical protein